jgi:hypothetical protein
VDLVDPDPDPPVRRIVYVHVPLRTETIHLRPVLHVSRILCDLKVGTIVNQDPRNEAGGMKIRIEV